MSTVLDALFGYKYNPDIKALMDEGAIIIDVRTTAEYEAGHIKSSLNIPHDKLETYINSLSKEKTIITCCETGIRSESAKRTLKSHGFEHVYNAGNWKTLLKYVNEKDKNNIID